MDNKVTTSNNNEIITEEGVMPSSSTTSGSNINYEDHVTVFVAYDGKWESDGKEWVFKESMGSIIVVSKYVTLSQITNILCAKFDVDQDSYGLKLEVYYRVGFPIIEIECDEDLSLFISKSSKTELLLCVTNVLKDDVAGGVEEDEINPDINEESPHGSKDNGAENRLIKAIEKGDWVKAREIVNTKKVRWASELDDDGYTALHYAVGAYQHNEVVREILMEINSDELETIVDNNGRNPAHIAAYVGNTKALKMMLKSNPKCLFISDYSALLPIHYSLESLAIKTFLYLFTKMKSFKIEYGKLFRGMSGLKLLHQVIDTKLIDVAYELINDFPSLATTKYRDKTALECIIRRPDLFYCGTYNYSFYSRFVYHMIPIENNSFGIIDTEDVENQKAPRKDKFVTKHTRRCHVISRIFFKLLWAATLQHVPYVKHLKDDKVTHNTTVELLRRICEEVDRKYTSSDIKRLYSSPFCLAVENNTPEAIDVLTTYFPGLCNSKKDGHNIYQLIVLNRSEKVYNYILHHTSLYVKSRFLLSKDDDGNNILHLAGRLAPIHKLNSASGAALQMQRELQWFEEVKRVVGIALRRELNKDRETPIMVFRKEHKELRKDGEEWMKKTADSYTITAALIITIVFASAITVPGGNDGATGKPIYETKASLLIFAISDAISLFTSTTSLLLFLSILTARYEYKDFLYKLPKRLIFGLVMLFVSVTSMMIAFSAALYIMFGQGKAWILIPIGALACLPIASFVTLQFPLLVELISSTYGHEMFGKQKGYRQSSASANKKKRT